MSTSLTEGDGGPSSENGHFAAQDFAQSAADEQPPEPVAFGRMTIGWQWRLRVSSESTFSNRVGFDDVRRPRIPGTRRLRIAAFETGTDFRGGLFILGSGAGEWIAPVVDDILSCRRITRALPRDGRARWSRAAPTGHVGPALRQG